MDAMKFTELPEVLISLKEMEADGLLEFEDDRIDS